MSLNAGKNRLPWADLRRLFEERRPLPVRQVEALLGCDAVWIAGQLDIDPPPPSDAILSWAHMAMLIRAMLTPAEIDAAFGTARGFPALLRVSPVRWRLPAYLLIALEHLVAEARATDPGAARLTVEALVARELDLMLDPELFERLSIEPAFREAYQFPADNDGKGAGDDRESVENAGR